MLLLLSSLPLCTSLTTASQEALRLHSQASLGMNAQSTLGMHSKTAVSLQSKTAVGMHSQEGLRTRRSQSALRMTSQAAARMQTEAELSVTNPVRRVIEMIQALKEKAQKLQKEDDELWATVLCKYKPMLAKQKDLVDRLGSGLPGLQLSIERLKAEIAQLKREIKEAYSSKRSAESLRDQAKSIRDKESKENKQAIDDYSQNSYAITQALTVLSNTYKEGAASFAQTHTRSADVLRKLVVAEDMTNSERDMLNSFLSVTSNGTQPVEGSGFEIIAVLKTIDEKMKEGKETVERTEAEAQSKFDAMMQNTEGQIATLHRFITAKNVASANEQAKLIQEEVSYDQLLNGGYLKAKAAYDAMVIDFSTKQQNYDQRTKDRTEEIAALTEAEQVLNSDDSLAVFKRALPSPEFMELQTSRQDLMKKARAALQNRKGKRDYRIDLIELSMHAGKLVDFGKVLKKIDGMVSLLKDEQTNDDNKKRWCMSHIDDANYWKRSHRRSVAEYTGRVAVSQTEVDTLEELIAETRKEKKELDYEVVEAGEQRKKENALFTQEDDDNHEAYYLLAHAKDKLAQVYLGASASLIQAQHGKTGANVVGIMAGLMQELDKILHDIETEERKLQLNYGFLMQDMKDEREGLVKRFSGLEEELGWASGSLHHDKDDLRYFQQNLKDQERTLATLHADCDWLLNNYQTRKDARVSEIESLKTASLVLKGADVDVSLLQEEQDRHRARGLLRGR